MRCREARRQLTESTQGSAAKATADHLTHCAPCQRYATRLAEARRALRDRRSDFVPDPAFAARVLARLPSREAATSELLGWAALRLLPATLALLLSLGLWSLASSPSPTALLAEETSQDLLSWVLDDGVLAGGGSNGGPTDPGEPDS